MFGLSIEQYNHLSHIVNDIYHVGAFVNHIYDYASLRAANVESTKEIVHLASTGIGKKVIYISSLSAILPTEDECIDEVASKRMEALYEIPDAYSQTKWVSEYLLHQAFESGMEIKIIRPGWILGDQQSGIQPIDNHLLCLIQSCINTGVAPAWDCNLRFLPVDFVARTIVAIGLSSNKSEFYNLINIHSIKWTNLVHWLNKRGHIITLIPVDKWVNDYLPYLSKDDPMLPFVPLYLDSKYRRATAPDIQGDIVQNNTMLILHKTGLIYPKIDDSLLDLYFPQLTLYSNLRNLAVV